MQSKFHFSKKHLVLLLSFLLLSIASGVYITQLSQPKVVDLDEQRDTAEILNLFKDDWYWLVQSKDFSPSYMLKTRSRSEDPKHQGNMHIKVLRFGDNFLGFTAYYKEYNNTWRILFLAVKQSERGKRYGERLINFALQDMKGLGARRVVLATREKNESAKKLYSRVGFKQIELIDGFVEFEYVL